MDLLRLGSPDLNATLGQKGKSILCNSPPFTRQNHDTLIEKDYENLGNLLRSPSQFRFKRQLAGTWGDSGLNTGEQPCAPPTLEGKSPHRMLGGGGKAGGRTPPQGGRAPTQKGGGPPPREPPQRSHPTPFC